MAKHYLHLPNKKLLKKTGELDYYHWSYQFPLKYLMRFRYNKILDLLGEKKYNTILEAGTGSGIFLPELSKHCKELYACDIHNYFQDIASMCDKSGVRNYHLSRQSIDNTNYPEQSFDAIVALSLLEFVPDIEKAVNEIKRILREDGVFITILPMESEILDFFLSFYLRKSPREEFSDARQKVSKILEENFSVVRKGYLTPLVGKYFPVYTYYKLEKPIYKVSTINMGMSNTADLKNESRFAF
ncbi:MAG: class I SAM-dependent methyltransferase [Ginsengibacter sp.]|jgi:ubiquinone/menaquinone biosynthesis C-methylase UbiE